jgi:poly-gamma-glutamate synthesis protein (capsule biosynthesis protein)
MARIPWRVANMIEQWQLAAAALNPPFKRLEFPNIPASATMVAVGDLVLTRRVREASKHGDEYLWGPLHTVLQNADLRTGNVEALPTSEDVRLGRLGSHMRVSPKAIGILQRARFDVVTVANNHSLDFGTRGLLDGINTLEAGGIQTCGAGPTADRARRPVCLNVNGVLVGVLGYCDDHRHTDDGGYIAPALELEIVRDIERLRKNVDFIVVHLHWGYEFVLHPLRIHRDIARSVADAGADLVLCHHSHVPMGIEAWKGSVISYGLGNCMFEHNHYLRSGHRWTKQSYALTVRFGADGVSTADVVPFAIREDGSIKDLDTLDCRSLLGALTMLSQRITDTPFLDRLQTARVLWEGKHELLLLDRCASDFNRVSEVVHRGGIRHRMLMEQLGKQEAGRDAAEYLKTVASLAADGQKCSDFLVNTAQRRRDLIASLTPVIPDRLPGRTP